MLIHLLKDKSGYEYIEAAFVLPLTVLVVTAILSLMVLIFQNFYEETILHQEILEDSYCVSEIEKIRTADKVVREFESFSKS